MAIRFRPATPEEEASLPPTILGDGSKLQGSTMVATCDADHCSVEERAVIEAAILAEVTFNQHVNANTYKAFQDYEDKYLAADEELRKAVNALLTARKEAG